MAVVLPVVAFPDRGADWLGYLARVTRWTIGARCTAAEVVAAGRFDAAREALTVDEILKGDPGHGPIPLALPQPAATGSPPHRPRPGDGDRLLMFGTLDGGPLDVPGAVVPAWATADLDADIGVARWFAGLPTDPGARAEALAAVAGDPAEAGRSSALRAIGDEKLRSASPVVHRAAAETADPATASYAAVTLWLLDERAAATEALAAITDRTGDDEFRALWGVKPSIGDRVPTVFGPDPDAWSRP
ncbi:hypothetical protein AB0M54_10095 [Actinoplanes sp. NPDC051470]|uniref:hypothetical protein n=1 Tax=unclassified Actinoplanes TaxID=2626549 RepID=UPI0034452E00